MVWPRHEEHLNQKDNSVESQGDPLPKEPYRDRCQADALWVMRHGACGEKCGLVAQTNW